MVVELKECRRSVSRYLFISLSSVGDDSSHARGALCFFSLLFQHFPIASDSWSVEHRVQWKIFWPLNRLSKFARNYSIDSSFPVDTENSFDAVIFQFADKIRPLMMSSQVIERSQFVRTFLCSFVHVGSPYDRRLLFCYRLGGQFSLLIDNIFPNHTRFANKPVNEWMTQRTESM